MVFFNMYPAFNCLVILCVIITTFTQYLCKKLHIEKGRISIANQLTINWYALFIGAYGGLLYFIVKESDYGMLFAVYLTLNQYKVPAFNI